MGWEENGELLALMAGEFDVFITADQNLTYQQNLGEQSIAFLVLVAPTNKLESLIPLVPMALEKLETIQPGDVVIVSLTEE